MHFQNLKLLSNISLQRQLNTTYLKKDIDLNVKQYCLIDFIPNDLQFNGRSYMLVNSQKLFCDNIHF